MRLPAVSFVALLLLWATPSRADPVAITITSGSIEYFPFNGEDFRIFGTGGFSWLSGSLGVASPSNMAPGETVRIDGFWDGGVLATFAGETYTHLGNPNSSNNAQLRVVSDNFVGPAKPPGSSTTTLFVPFTLTGLFQGIPGDGFPHPGQGEPLRATLSGGGTAQMPLTWVGGVGEGAWQVGLVHLDMMAPTPEPASLALLGLGLAGAWSLRRPTRERS